MNHLILLIFIIRDIYYTITTMDIEIEFDSEDESIINTEMYMDRLLGDYSIDMVIENKSI